MQSARASRFVLTIAPDFSFDSSHEFVPLHKYRLFWTKRWILTRIKTSYGLLERLVTQTLWNLKTDADTISKIKLFANGRSIVGQQFSIFLGVACCVRFYTMLHVVACCWELSRQVWNRSNFWANNPQHFFSSVIADAQRNNVGAINIALNIVHSFWGSRTRITHCRLKTSFTCVTILSLLELELELELYFYLNTVNLSDKIKNYNLL